MTFESMNTGSVEADSASVESNFYNQQYVQQSEYNDNEPQMMDQMNYEMRSTAEAAAAHHSDQMANNYATYYQQGGSDDQMMQQQDNSAPAQRSYNPQSHFAHY